MKKGIASLFAIALLTTGLGVGTASADGIGAHVDILGVGAGAHVGGDGVGAGAHVGPVGAGAHVGDHPRRCSSWGYRDNHSRYCRHYY